MDAGHEVTVLETTVVAKIDEVLCTVITVVAPDPPVVEAPTPGMEVATNPPEEDVTCPPAELTEDADAQFVMIVVLVLSGTRPVAVFGEVGTPTAEEPVSWPTLATDEVVAPTTGEVDATEMTPVVPLPLPTTGKVATLATEVLTLAAEPEPTTGVVDSGVTAMVLVDKTTTTLEVDPEPEPTDPETELVATATLAEDVNPEPAPTETVDEPKMAAELEEAAQSLTVM